MRYTPAFCLCAFILGITLETSAEDSRWTLTIGPESRIGMKVKATGSSYVQTFGLSSASQNTPATPSGITPPPYRLTPDTALPTSYGNRSYDDGYVNMDDGTDFPGAIVPGMTWFWGYDNAQQFDPDSQTLSFHHTSAETDTQQETSEQTVQTTTRDILRNETMNEDCRQNAYGVGLSVSRQALRSSSLQIDMAAGLRGMKGAECQLNASTYSERIREDRFRVADQTTYTDQHSYRDTYSYDTAGVIPPPAPYEGTLDGPGPVIPNIPSSVNREVLGSSRQASSSRNTTPIGTTSWTAANDIDISVNSALYDAWLGPRFRFFPDRAVNLVADTRFSLNYVDIQVDRWERFQSDRNPGAPSSLYEWKDEASHADWIPSFGLTLGIEAKIDAHWRIGVHGGYDWMSRDVDVNIGPNTVSLSPGGYSAGADVIMSF